MVKFQAVGRSDRTPIKHWLLDKALGQLVGVVSTGNAPCTSPVAFIDMCAGDGHTTEQHEASPHIMFRHANWLANKDGHYAALNCIEKMDATYDQLVANCQESFDAAKAKRLKFKLIKDDARKYVFPKEHRTSRRAAFVHCDPNTVADMPITPEFVASWNKWTTCLITLGCNVGGLKRLDREFREPWFGYVGSVTSKIPTHHDAILYWLMGDNSQWAYLLTVPKVWTVKYLAMTPKMSQLTEYTVGAASWRTQRKAFDAQLRYLFLTEKERQ